MKKYFTTKTITGLGILTAILIVLFGLSNVIKIGNLTLNLTLVPIAVGACLFGPFGGFFLGFVDGLLNLLVGEVGAFMAVNAWATVIVVILKTSLAGLIAGFAFLPFKKNHPFVGCVIASCLVPLVNTGLFIVGCILFFMSLVEQISGSTGSAAIGFIFIGFVGINFIIEFATNSVLSTLVHTVYKVQEKKKLA